MTRVKQPADCPALLHELNRRIGDLQLRVCLSNTLGVPFVYWRMGQEMLIPQMNDVIRAEIVLTYAALTDRGFAIWHRYRLAVEW
jgi:hypothetical protein